MNIILQILIYIPLVVLAPGGAYTPPPPPEPATSSCVSAADYPNVQAALVVAETGSTHCLELPAGTYDVDLAGGRWLDITQFDMEIRGAGMGQTIIRATGGITLTQNLYLINIAAPRAYVHDLTIRVEPGYTGTSEIGGVRVDASADHVMIERVEVSGGYSGNERNGFGIGTYRPWLNSGGAQYVTIQNCYIHDSLATAIGVNSSHNTLRNNWIERIGTNGLQHGFYAQGGYNEYTGNTVVSVSGYSFHGWKKVPNLDASGDRYSKNVSINPGTGHVIVSGEQNTDNPTFPPNADLTRNAVINNNIFRNTEGHASIGVIVTVPAVVQNNVFEDVYMIGANAIKIAEGADGSLVSANRLIGQTVNDIGLAAIQANAPAIVVGNTIDMNVYAGGLGANAAGVQFRNNRITRTTKTQDSVVAIGLNGDDAEVSGNYVSLNGGQVISAWTRVTGLKLHDNILLNPSRFVVRDTAHLSGVVENNRWTGQFNNAQGLTFRNNDGTITG